jgi:hypothetical protein
VTADDDWPIVGRKDHVAPSVFQPEALLGEARRQRQLPAAAVPGICVLDPDGDVVRHLKRTGAGRAHLGWNAMAQIEGDFEKGEENGAKATLAVITAGSDLSSQISFDHRFVKPHDIRRPIGE